MAVPYRVQQLLRALSARHVISQQRVEEATKSLSPSAQALFARQAPQDQQHAIAVYEALWRGGEKNDDLLAAALLHDVGKAAVCLRPWERGLLVLAQRLVPRALDRFTGGSQEGFWQPLAQYVRHAEIGASWARNVGCSSVTVELIQRHEDPLVTSQMEEDRLLAALQAADDVN